MTRKFLFVPLLAMIGFCGCSFGPPQADYSSLGLVEISGTITLDGSPLMGATIYFHNKPERVYSSGVTDTNGRYTLMFDSRKSGIIPGEKTIEIVDSDSSSEASFDSEGADPNIPQTVGKIPAKYNAKSTLSYTVTKSDDQVNFDLKSV